MWSEDIKQWWRREDKLYNINQKSSWEFEIFNMHSSGYSFWSRFIETPTMTHFKTLKRILGYIKCTIDFGLFYKYSNSFDLVGYSDSDWVRDINDRKSAMGFVFYIGDTSFTWNSSKQSIITLLICEAEYVVNTSCVYC